MGAKLLPRRRKGDTSAASPPKRTFAEFCEEFCVGRGVLIAALA